ncbi:MAG: hypothetical protein ACE5LU_27160, partial [Anaerolineae bacterium]
MAVQTTAGAGLQTRPEQSRRAVPPTRRPGQDWRTRVGHLLLHAFLLSSGILMTVPFLWMLSTSLTAQKDLFTYPPKWIPDPIAWSNYREIV